MQLKGVSKLLAVPTLLCGEVVGGYTPQPRVEHNLPVISASQAQPQGIGDKNQKENKAKNEFENMPAFWKFWPCIALTPVSIALLLIYLKLRKNTLQAKELIDSALRTDREGKLHKGAKIFIDKSITGKKEELDCLMEALDIAERHFPEFTVLRSDEALTVRFNKANDLIQHLLTQEDYDVESFLDEYRSIAKYMGEEDATFSSLTIPATEKSTGKTVMLVLLHKDLLTNKIATAGAIVREFHCMIEYYKHLKGQGPKPSIIDLKIDSYNKELIVLRDTARRFDPHDQIAIVLNKIIKVESEEQQAWEKVKGRL